MGANPKPWAGVRAQRQNRLHVCFPGGLAAVIYTDTLQTLIMVFGAAILTATGKAGAPTPSLQVGSFVVVLIKTNTGNRHVSPARGPERDAISLPRESAQGDSGVCR